MPANDERHRLDNGKCTARSCCECGRSSYRLAFLYDESVPTPAAGIRLHILKIHISQIVTIFSPSLIFCSPLPEVQEHHPPSYPKTIASTAGPAVGICTGPAHVFFHTKDALYTVAKTHQGQATATTPKLINKGNFTQATSCHYDGESGAVYVADRDSNAVWAVAAGFRDGREVRPQKIALVDGANHVVAFNTSGGWGRWGAGGWGVFVVGVLLTWGGLGGLWRDRWRVGGV